MTDSPVADAAHTSDGTPRPNMLSREEFIRRVLYSGDVTRIAQHLAVVIFLVAEGRNQLNLSVRDLERITGWSRPTIKDHLAELEVFVRVTFGGGRAKALFELQGVIEDALSAAVVAGSRDARLPQELMAREVATKVVANQVAKTELVAKEIAANLVAKQVATRSVVANQPATKPFVANQVATTFVASLVATSPVMANQVAITEPPPAVVANQVATSPSYTERERDIISKIPNLSLLSTTPRAEPAEEADPVHINGVAIHGPGFKIAYAAIDQAAFLIGMPKERARAIAEICAHDWAANNKKPDSPMAMIKKAMKTDFNEGQVQEIKLEKAKATASSAPAESRKDRLLRHVRADADKGGRQ